MPAALGVVLALAACAPASSTTSPSGGGGGGASGPGGDDGGSAGGSSTGGSSSGGAAAASTGSGSSSSSGGGGAGGSGAGGAGGGSEVDACEGASPVCDDTPPAASGLGLAPLDRCGFALDRAASFDQLPALVDALEAKATPVGLDVVLADLNRSPIPVAPSAVPGDPPGVDFAFRWDDEENDKPTWVPQGITSSSDARADGRVLGRELIVVSSYFDEDEAPGADPKGVRLAFVDVTDPAAPRYRFALLVEPLAGGDLAPIRIHAGGIAWVGDILYVADTSKGLRVFDTRRFLQVDTSEDVIGCDATTCRAGLYKYALPQIGAYARSSPCAEAPRFSFVALDRSASPPLLVSGEYCAETACSAALAGRVFRWPVDAGTGLLAGGARTWSADAHFMGERQVQGGVSSDGVFYLSSSEPPSAGGALYRVTEAGRDAFGWIDTPEDVVVDVGAGRILSLSEGLGDRHVMAADLGAYQP
jgi:hypothetical protein